MSGLFGGSATRQQRYDKGQRRADAVQLRADRYKGTRKEAKAQSRADAAQARADEYWQAIPGNENKERGIGASEDYTGVAVGPGTTQGGTAGTGPLTRIRNMARARKPKTGQLGPVKTALS